MSDKDTLITDELYQRSIDDIPISADDYMAPEEDDSVSTDYLTDAVFLRGRILVATTVLHHTVSLQELYLPAQEGIVPGTAVRTDLVPEIHFRETLIREIILPI